MTRLGVSPDRHGDRAAGQAMPSEASRAQLADVNALTGRLRRALHSGTGRPLVAWVVTLTDGRTRSTCTELTARVPPSRLPALAAGRFVVGCGRVTISDW